MEIVMLLVFRWKWKKIVRTML